MRKHRSFQTLARRHQIKCDTTSREDRRRSSEINYLTPSLFYMSSLIRSRFPGKDLTTVKGLIDTLEFETLDRRGNIKLTWMEYVLSTFKKVNGKNAKKIVLYLCQHRDREVTRAELLKKLNLGLEDSELEEKLETMVKGDIISQGASKFRYRGINDNIFDKVFRGVYGEEIQGFDIRLIRKEYSEEVEKLEKQYNRLLGKYNCDIKKATLPSI